MTPNNDVAFLKYEKCVKKISYGSLGVYHNAK